MKRDRHETRTVSPAVSHGQTVRQSVRQSKPMITLAERALVSLSQPLGVRQRDSRRSGNHKNETKVRHGRDREHIESMLLLAEGFGHGRGWIRSKTRFSEQQL